MIDDGYSAMLLPEEDAESFTLPSMPVVGFLSPPADECESLAIGKPIRVEMGDTYFVFTPGAPSRDNVAAVLGYEGLELCTPSHLFRALHSCLNLLILRDAEWKKKRLVEFTLTEFIETYVGGKGLTNTRDPKMRKLMYQLLTMLPYSDCEEYVYNEEQAKITLRSGRFIHLEPSVDVFKDDSVGEVKFYLYSIRDSLKDESNLLYFSERRADYWQRDAYLGGGFEKKVSAMSWRDYVDRQVSIANFKGTPIGVPVSVDGREYNGDEVTELRIPVKTLVEFSGCGNDRMKLFHLKKDFESYVSTFACVRKISKIEGSNRTVLFYSLLIELARAKSTTKSYMGAVQISLDSE